MDILQTLAGSEKFVLTWDIAVVIAVFLIIFLYAFSVNKKKLHMFVLSIYAGFAFISLFPFWNEVVGLARGASVQFISLILFLGFVFLVNFALSGSIFGISFPKLKNKPVFQTTLLATAASGFLTSLVFSDIFGVFGGNLSTITEQFFAQDIAQFVWATTPIVAVFVSRKTSKTE
ncbi:MAG: hypothetical protein WD712_02565 [Candidatus Spechtbacterales bacterium]